MKRKGHQEESQQKLTDRMHFFFAFFCRDHTTKKAKKKLTEKNFFFKMQQKIISKCNTVQPRYNVTLILRTFRYTARFLRSRTERLFVFVFSTLILRTFSLTYL